MRWNPEGLVSRPWASVVVAIAVLLLVVLRPNMSSDLRNLLLLVLGGLMVHILQAGVFFSKSLTMIKLGLREVMREEGALLESSAKCGLTAVYPEREFARKDVMEGINKAQERVWLLGISLSSIISLTEFINNLKTKVTVRTVEGDQAVKKLWSEFHEGRLTSGALFGNLKDLLSHGKIDRSFDLKVLLLDPLRSPAVFRSCLECALEEFERIIDVPLPRGGPLDPLFQQKLYGKTVGDFATISREGNEAFRDRVRFYAHNPNCWLVIADDTAYFEPYTFGSPKESGVDSSMGPYFPVFRFDAAKEDKPFRILENHFTRLWLTSDVDYFHFESRLEGQDHIVTELFSRRTDWYKRAHAALKKWKDTGADPRKWPRRSCDSEPAVRARVSWQDGGSVVACDATIYDYSREGISLELNNGCTPSADVKAIKLSQQEQNPPSTEQALWLMNYFGRKELLIKWTKEQGHAIRMGLHGTRSILERSDSRASTKALL